MAKPDMPKMSKAPPELVERFATILERFPAAERRKMFGYPAAFVGGNLATSLFRDRWVVRLSESDAGEAIAGGAAPFEPMPGRPMKGFVLVPPADVADDDRIAWWVERGIGLASSLPRK